jgi:hypothetical protein
MTATMPQQDFLVLPYAVTSEAKAQMFAAAVEELELNRIETKIFEDCGKWFVAVTKGMEYLGNPIDVSIDTAAVLLMRFDFVKGGGDDLECIADTISDIPPAQEALAKRARRVFCIEDRMNALEVKLDAVLAALVGSEAAKNLGL